MKLFGHEITQIICNSIDAIVIERLAKAPFDRTIMGIVQSFEGFNANEKKINTKYKIAFQDATFYAYSNSIEKMYQNGDLVYVLVPENDFSKQKIIIGLAEGNNHGALFDNSETLLLDKDGLLLFPK